MRGGQRRRVATVPSTTVPATAPVFVPSRSGERAGARGETGAHQGHGVRAAGRVVGEGERGSWAPFALGVKVTLTPQEAPAATVLPLHASSAARSRCSR